MFLCLGVNACKPKNGVGAPPVVAGQELDDGGAVTSTSLSPGSARAHFSSTASHWRAESGGGGDDGRVEETAQHPRRPLRSQDLESSGSGGWSDPVAAEEEEPLEELWRLRGRSGRGTGTYNAYASTTEGLEREMDRLRRQIAALEEEEMREFVGRRSGSAYSSTPPAHHSSPPIRRANGHSRSRSSLGGAVDEPLFLSAEELRRSSLAHQHSLSNERDRLQVQCHVLAVWGGGGVLFVLSGHWCGSPALLSP